MRRLAFILVGLLLPRVAVAFDPKCEKALIDLYAGSKEAVNDNPLEARRALEALVKMPAGQNRDYQVDIIARELAELDPESTMAIIGRYDINAKLKEDIALRYIEAKPMPSPQAIRALRRLRLPPNALTGLALDAIGMNEHDGLGYKQVGTERDLLRTVQALGLPGENAARIVMRLAYKARQSDGAFYYLRGPQRQAYLDGIGKWLKSRPMDFQAGFRKEWLALVQKEDGTSGPRVVRGDYSLLGERELGFRKTELMEHLLSHPYKHPFSKELIAELKRRGDFTDEDFDKVATAVQAQGFHSMALSFPLHIKRWPWEKTKKFFQEADVPPRKIEEHATWGFSKEQKAEIARGLFLNRGSDWYQNGQDLETLNATMEQYDYSEDEKSQILRVVGETGNAWALAYHAPNMLDGMGRKGLTEYFLKYLDPYDYYARGPQAIRDRLREVGYLDEEIISLSIAKFTGSARTPADHAETVRRAMFLDSEDALNAVASVGIHYSPLETMKNHASALESEGILVADAMPAQRFREAVELLEAGKIPKHSYRPLKGTGRLLTDRVDDTEVAKGLLKALAIVEGVPPKRLPPDSLDLLARYAGIDPQWVHAKKLTEKGQGLRDLYAILLEARDFVRQPLFQGLRIEPKVYSRESFGKFLEVLEAIHTMTVLSEQTTKGTPVERWNGVLKQLDFPAHELTAEDVSRLHAAAEKQLLETLRPYVGSAMPTLSFDRLKTLSRDWGSLDPVYRLMGRFQGSDQWQQEIPELSKVFQASLEGKFDDLKFGGYLKSESRATEQLAPLNTTEAEEAWKANHSVVGYHSSAKGGDPRAGLNQTLRNTVDVQLTANLRDLPTVEAEAIGKVKAILELPEATANRQRRLREYFARMAPEEADKHVVAAVRAGLKNMTDPEQAAAFTKRFLPLAKDEKLFAYRVGPDAMNDFLVLSGLSDAAKKLEEGEFIVTTVTTHDPKLLLTVGSLVTDSSCQDYRSGGMIQTLLGYVQDANVKLSLGTALKKREFKNPKDFDRIKAALENGKDVQSHIVAKDKSFVFGWTEPDGNKIEIQSLGQDLLGRRHVLKLGAAGQDAGLRLERGYNTSTQPTEVLGNQALQLLGKVAKATGAKTGVEIRVPPSQNAGGVYSDASGGVKAEAYTIPADPEQVLK